jgi:alcohol dehydrogenase class IV
VSLLANNSFFAEDLFTVAPNEIQPALPLVTIPVEPCLGEELSGYFTLVDAHHNMRRFFTAEHIFPAACFYDITLCSHLRSDDAARIGGAMTAYAVERLIALGLNPLTETLLFKVLEFLKKDLPDFYAEPRLERVLTNMFWASAMCGMSLMTVPNGPVWAIAQVLRTKTKLKYYHALAIMLPFVMEYFLTSSSKKYIGISRIFEVDIQDNSVVEAAIQGIEAIRAMFSSLHLPTRLSEFYITEQQVPDIAKDVMVLSDFAHFPKKMSQDEIESILLSAI